MLFLSRSFSAGDQPVSATIDAVKRATNNVQIDFSVSGNPDRVYVEGASTPARPFRVQYNAELAPISENNFRGFVPISTENRFFRVRLLAQAETNSLVLPREAANSFAEERLTFAPQRFQQIYSSNEFSNAPLEITELAFRLDEGDTSGLDIFVSNFTVQMGILKQSMGQIPRDQWLYVPDAETVLTQEVAHLSGMRSENPQIFPIRITFQKPFIYDPAVGQLFLQFSSGPSDAASLDFEDFSFQRRGWIVAPQGTPGDPPLTGAAMIVTELRYISLQSLTEPATSPK